jgi:dienelactone hydrolase
MNRWVLIIVIAAMGTARAAERDGYFQVPDFRAVPPNVEQIGESVSNGVVTTEFMFDGGLFNGKPTRIYCQYSRPERPGRYPAVLEIHGAGLKRLTSEATQFYARNGFAALSFDWAGPGKDREGPTSVTWSPGGQAYPGERPDRWLLHGLEVDKVACGVRFARRCLMFLRSRPEVDSEKLFVSGMSAGAHLSLLLLGQEPGLRGAAIKYGCGFIRDTKNCWGGTKAGFFIPISLTSPADQDAWLAVYDPKHDLPRYRTSILMLTGTDDAFFRLPAVLRTYREIKSPKTLCVLPNDNHSQVGNTVLPLRYFQTVLGQAPAWPELTAPETRLQGDRLRLSTRIRAPSKLKQVEFAVRCRPKQRPEDIRKAEDLPFLKHWQTLPATESGGRWWVDVPAPGPDEQLLAYALAEDETGAQASSDTCEVPAWPDWRE